MILIEFILFVEIFDGRSVQRRTAIFFLIGLAPSEIQKELFILR